MKTKKFQVFREFFPKNMLDELNNFSNEQKSRKQEYSEHQNKPIPNEMSLAISYTEGKLNTPINTAILKHYTNGYYSKAYKMHIDPIRFSKAPLVFCTLNGEADLSIETGETINCRKNTVVVINPRLKHAVTPPKNDSGVRHLLFFGLSN